MAGISVNYSDYIHQYEAVRIPKDSAVLKSDSAHGVKEEDGSALVLTDEAKQQMIKDRAEFSASMLEERKKLQAEQHEEAVKKYTEDQAKMVAVFRSMAEGKTVSETDEKKLMEYDPKLYMSAKMAQMMAQRANEENEEHFHKEDEEKYEKDMAAYNDQVKEFNSEWNDKMDAFVNAQKSSIVEVDGSKMDVSSIKSVVNMGGGIAGAIFDASV